MGKQLTEGVDGVNASIPQRRICSKWNLLPILDIARRKIFRTTPRNIGNLAEYRWEIAQGEISTSLPAYFLPNQLERVKSWAFASEHPRREMVGGFQVTHSPTTAMLLKNAWLIDGVLYKGNACSYLQPRSSRWLPLLHVETEIDRGAVFCTSGGNKYFGQWLMDDCVTYPLATVEGIPVTTDQRVNPHTPAYEEYLDMKPLRIHSAFFKEVIIFEDVGQNRHKHARFRSMSQKLLSHVNAQSHPGVFILRGNTGERRILLNEIELAEYLRDKRGFRILNPAKSDVRTIIATCAGARAVVGVEGSGLMHGILVLPPGGSVLTLQPPNRFVCLYKHLTDRDNQNFGFVVGIEEGNGFRINPNEVEQTLDLLPEFPAF